MAGWNEMSGAAKGGAGAAVAVVVAVLGWFALDGGPGKGPGEAPQVQDAAAPAESAPAASEVAAEPAPQPTAEAAAEPVVEPTAEATPVPPSIDVLRIAPDGSATIAGVAEPGATLSVQVNGAVVATIEADGSGQFASLFTLAPSAAGQMLTLVMRAADGTVIAGTEGVAVAPIAEPEPVAVAAAETTAEPVAEPEAPAAIIVTEDGAQVTQTAEAVPADLAAEVSLDVISYTAEGAVQLGGKGTAGAAILLYLDNAPLAQSSVAGDGLWSFVSKDIAPGIYTLRIDQADAAGNVTSRLETPFKRETLEALAAASGATAPAEAAPEQTETQTAEAAVETQTAETAEAGSEVAAESAEASAAEATAETSGEGTVAAEATTGTGTESVADAPAASETSAAEEPAVEPVAETTVVETEVAAAEPAPAEPVAEVSAEPVAAEAATEETAEPAPAPVTVTVQPGFTLWAIAKENFGSGVMYVQVYEANRDKIKDPDLIYPGQVLSVPAAP